MLSKATGFASCKRGIGFQGEVGRWQQCLSMIPIGTTRAYAAASAPYVEAYDARSRSQPAVLASKHWFEQTLAGAEGPERRRQVC